MAPKGKDVSAAQREDRKECTIGSAVSNKDWNRRGDGSETFSDVESSYLQGRREYNVSKGGREGALMLCRRRKSVCDSGEKETDVPTV
jgi:hypothetical protein